MKFDNLLKFSEYISWDYYLLLAGVILIIILYNLPKYRRPIIQIDSDNFNSCVRWGFKILIGVIIIFNFFIYFIQPTYREKLMSVERRENRKNVQIKILETGEQMTITPHLYNFLLSYPDRLYYRKITNWLWDNFFLINNIAIFAVICYSFFFNVVFKVKMFYHDNYRH